MMPPPAIAARFSPVFRHGHLIRSLSLPMIDTPYASHHTTIADIIDA